MRKESEEAIRAIVAERTRRVEERTAETAKLDALDQKSAEGFAKVLKSVQRCIQEATKLLPPDVVASFVKDIGRRDRFVELDWELTPVDVGSRSHPIVVNFRGKLHTANIEVRICDNGTVAGVENIDIKNVRDERVEDVVVSVIKSMLARETHPRAAT